MVVLGPELMSISLHADTNIYLLGQIHYNFSNKNHYNNSIYQKYDSKRL